MSNHTPGPWRAYHDSHGRFQLIGPDGTPLDPESDDAQPGEGAANARLIASAPDLLAALEQTLSTLDAICDMEGFDKHVQHGSREAREAITKAKAGGAK